MDYRHYWISRVSLTLVFVATGGLLVPAAEAAGHGGRSAACGQPQGPIFQTLDALAGGIELVLQRTVLSCRTSSACDAVRCDDGCDAATLQPFETLPMPATAYGQSPPRSGGAAPRPHASLHAQPVPQPSAEPRLRPLPNSRPGPRLPATAKPLPQVPAERGTLSTEDSWIDSFSPSQPAAGPVLKRSIPPQSPQRDSADPFRDDPQGGR